MAIKHAFVSLKADGPDTSLVRPTPWNEPHTVDPNTITYAMLQDVGATDRLLGRFSPGAGDVEELPCTPFARTILDDASAADARNTLGLGTAAVQPTSAFEAAGAVAAHAALTTVHGISAFGSSLVDDANAAAARTTLGLAAIAATGSGADLGAGTVTLTKLANLSSQRAIGRNTGGSGQPEEVTAAQILEWASSSDGILARSGGSWATAANAGIHGGNIVHTTATPTTPDYGTVKEFGIASAGRPMLAVKTPDNIDSIVQPHMGYEQVVSAQPIAASNNHTTWGCGALTFTGTATSRALATTTLVTSSSRLGVVSAGPAGSIAGLRIPVLRWWRGNASGLGGFHLVFTWAVSDAALVTDAKMFAGLWGTTSAPTDVNPSTLTNIVGVGCDASDTTLQLYAAGSSAQARTSLGANFPVNTVSTDLYRMALYAPPNGSEIRWQVTRVNTPHIASDTITASANLPASTQFLAFQAWRTNSTTAAACAIDWTNLWIGV